MSFPVGATSVAIHAVGDDTLKGKEARRQERPLQHPQFDATDTKTNTNTYTIIIHPTTSKSCAVFTNTWSGYPK